MSVLKHLRSSTADKRPVASGIADGQLAINTASGTPGLYIRDNASGIVKIGPAHVGGTAPNAVPAGSSGNSRGELWVDTSTTTAGLKYFNGSAFVNLTPSGTTTTVGLVELATAAETQAGTDAVRAVTPSGLQSKVSDSTSTTSSTTIASATAVKTAYDLANAALSRSGGTISGELLIGPSGSLVFEGSSDDSFETTLAVVNPTADRTITFPNTTGTVITTGDSGTVTSAMIADGAIVDADVNTSAAIAGTKISPDFGSQNSVTTGSSTASSFIPTGSGVPANGMYLPAANQLALSTGSSERARIDSSGRLLIGTSTSVSQFGIQPQIQSTGTSGAGGYLGLAVFNTAVDSAPSLVLGHSKGGSVGTYTASATNDLLGEINFTAANGTDMRRGASIAARADGDWGTNDHPARLIFSTTADGASGPVERMRITSGGNVGIGTTSPGAIFHTDQASGGSSVIGAAIRNNSTTASTGVILDLTPSTASPGVRSAQLEAVNNGSNQISFNLKLANAADPITRFSLSPTGTATIFAAQGGIPFIANVGTSEVVRIDSAGRLLIGTSSAQSSSSTGLIPALQLNSSNSNISSSTFGVFANSASNSASVRLFRNRATTAGGFDYTGGTVQANDVLGSIEFWGVDGGATPIMRGGAAIQAICASTPTTTEMPTDLVFLTTADGTSSPTEALRITNDRVIAYNQAAPVSKSTAATLTIAELKGGIIQYTGNAQTLTLPTGTLSEGGFSGLYTNMTFQWSVINTGSGTCTVTGDTGHTVVGAGAVAAGSSGRFASRRTGANTFVTYRLS